MVVDRYDVSDCPSFPSSDPFAARCRPYQEAPPLGTLLALQFIYIHTAAHYPLRTSDKTLDRGTVGIVALVTCYRCKASKTQESSAGLLSILIPNSLGAIFSVPVFCSRFH